MAAKKKKGPPNGTRKRAMSGRKRAPVVRAMPLTPPPEATRQKYTKLYLAFYTAQREYKSARNKHSSFVKNNAGKLNEGQLKSLHDEYLQARQDAHDQLVKEYQALMHAVRPDIDDNNAAIRLHTSVTKGGERIQRDLAALTKRSMQARKLRERAKALQN